MRPSPEILGAFCGAEIPFVRKPCSTDQAYTAPFVLRLRAARFHRSERERDKRPKRGRDRREWRVPLFSSLYVYTYQGPISFSPSHSNSAKAKTQAPISSMISLDLALCHRVVSSAADVFDAFVVEPLTKLARQVGWTVIAQ